MFCKECVLRLFAIFTGKYLCQSLFFNKVGGSGTGVFLWILRNFCEHLFHRTRLGDCFKALKKETFIWLLFSFHTYLRCVKNLWRRWRWMCERKAFTSLFPNVSLPWMNSLNKTIALIWSQSQINAQIFHVNYGEKFKQISVFLNFKFLTMKHEAENIIFSWVQRKMEISCQNDFILIYDELYCFLFSCRQKFHEHVVD